MEYGNQQRFISAILNQGNPDLSTPSQPFLDLLKELATEGALSDIAEAVADFATVYPDNFKRVRSELPSILANYYLPTVVGGIEFEVTCALNDARPGWPNELREALADASRLADVLASLVTLIKRIRIYLRKRERVRELDSKNWSPSDAQMQALHARYRAAVARTRNPVRARRLVDHLFRSPVISVAVAGRVLGITCNEYTYLYLKHFIDLNILQKDPEGRFYVATEIEAVMNATGAID